MLGEADDPEVQFLCIAFEHGLRTEFPAAVAAEAEALPADPHERDLAGRRDLRALPFVTIDGETARDFDDAVCLEPQAGGGVRLWVAIADVAHYVAPRLGARRRGGGARHQRLLPRPRHPDAAGAPVERAVLAQPRARSPGARRRARTTTAAARAAACDCYRAVIRSRARLTYTEVAAVLSDTDTAEIRARRGDARTAAADARAHARR